MESDLRAGHQHHHAGDPPLDLHLAAGWGQECRVQVQCSLLPVPLLSRLGVSYPLLFRATSGEGRPVDI